MTVAHVGVMEDVGDLSSLKEAGATEYLKGAGVGAAEGLAVGTVGKLVANGLDNGEDPKAPFYYASVPGATAGALMGLADTAMEKDANPAMKGMALGALSGGLASGGAEVFMHAVDHPESIVHDTIIGAMTGAIGDGVVRGLVIPNCALHTTCKVSTTSRPTLNCFSVGPTVFLAHKKSAVS